MNISDLWRDILRETDILEGRPDFYFDPAFYAMHYSDLVESGIDLRKHFDRHGKEEGRLGTAYQATRTQVPDLDKHLTEIVTDSRLRAEIDAGNESVFELIFELVSLGDPIDRKVSSFSQRQYLQAYPDIQKAGLVAFHHYIRFGRTEGRRTLRDILENQFRGKQEFDPSKPTCAICVHEFSRSGAPIVGLELAKSATKTHNIIVMALRPGPLLEDFQQTSFSVIVSDRPDDEMDFFDLPDPSTLDFAILNSVECFPFSKAFIRRLIPFSNYVHEFTDNMPVGKCFWTALFSDLMIFGSEAVRESWKSIFTDMRFDITRDSIVIPQRELKKGNPSWGEYNQSRDQVSRLIGVDCANRRIIYGAGNVEWRKGTDLFVLIAQMAKKRDPSALFLWLGDRRNHEDINFGVWLEKHLREADSDNREGNLFFLPAGPYYNDVCYAADTLLLPSRLDPLPNVVFDAIQFGCSVTLFQNATGFDDPSYARNQEISKVEYGDLVGACDLVLSAPMKRPARVNFASLRRSKPGPDIFTQISKALKEHLAARRYFVAGSGDYDIPMLFSTRDQDRDARRNEREKMWSYNRLWVWRSPAQAEAELAASDNWMHQNSRIERFAWLGKSPKLDYSIHMHAHYFDDLGADLRHYKALKEAQRIVVTTDTNDKADQIRRIAKEAGVSVEVLVVANKGRDILPFMQLFNNAHAGDDEIWCHLHQKKSISVMESEAGETWRRFLMTILLGDDRRVSSALSHIASPEIGLVSPFDPSPSNWAGSRRLLPQIAPKLPGPMPEHVLLFPIGNMFWTRGRVVAQMNGIFDVDYPWPNEPIANDGTIFHLIERLWPAATTMAGLDAVFLDKPDQKRV